jgi:hypothetical protein
MHELNNELESMIRALVESREDYDKFFSKGNSSAGTRLRKTMQEVKSAAQVLRISVQTAKNSD